MEGSQTARHWTRAASALRLRQYGIKSKQIRDGTTNKKGYQRADLVDAWARYLPPPRQAKQGKQPKHSRISNAQVFRMKPKMFRIAPRTFPLNGGTKNPTKSTSVSDVSDVSIFYRMALGGMSDVADRPAVSDVSDDGWRNDQADDIPTDQTCAQCNGTIDGTERMVSVSGHTVWLHETCQHFWIASVVGKR